MPKNSPEKQNIVPPATEDLSELKQQIAQSPETQEAQRKALGSLAAAIAMEHPEVLSQMPPRYVEQAYERLSQQAA